MNNLLKYFFSGIVSVFLSIRSTDAIAQPRLHEGARPGAMGDAFVAVSDDASGVAFNPAGLVYSPQRLLVEFSLQNLFSSGLPFRDELNNEGALTHSSFSIVYNRLERPNQTRPILVLGSHEATEHLLASPSLAPTSNVYSVGVSGSWLNTGLMNQFALGVSLGKGFFEKSTPGAITNHLPHWLAVSLAGKIVGMQYDAQIVEQAEVNSAAELEAIRNFFAQNGRSRFGLGVDAGAMLALHPRLQLAFAWSNLARPNLALEGVAHASAAKRFGAALWLQPQWQWLLAIDVEQNDALHGWRLFAGTESGLPNIDANLLKLRVGINDNWVSTGFRIAKPSLFELSYAFIFPSFLRDDQPEGFFNHRFSLSFSKPAPSRL